MVLRESGPGNAFVGVVGIVVATVLLVVAIVSVLCLLVAVWPDAGLGATTSATPIYVLGQSFKADLDQRLFMAVSLAGALGGLLHSTRSLCWYVGNRMLKRSWLATYVCLPFVGAAMAVVFYLVFRGGLVPASGGSEDVNVFGFAAVAALVGLFSSQAAEKLKQVFSTLLTPAQAGKDRVEPQVTALDRTKGPVGTLVRITGTGLGGATEVIFGGVSTSVTVVSPEVLTASVPAGATTGDVQVKVDDRIVTGPRFEVE